MFATPMRFANSAASLSSSSSANARPTPISNSARFGVSTNAPV